MVEWPIIANENKTSAAPKRDGIKLALGTILFVITNSTNPDKATNKALPPLDSNASCNIIGSKVLAMSPPMLPASNRKLTSDTTTPKIALLLTKILQ